MAADRRELRLHRRPVLHRLDGRLGRLLPLVPARTAFVLVAQDAHVDVPRRAGRAFEMHDAPEPVDREPLRRRPRGDLRLRTVFRQGDREGEGGAAVRPGAVAPDAAAVLLDDALGDVEAEAGAGTLRRRPFVRLAERLEQTQEILRTQADAGVLDP